MKILSFGHIPTWAGGRQSSGLANVIYQLAKHGSEVEDTEVVLAATDCYVPRHEDGKLSILGWTKPMLLRYIIVHPIRSVKSVFTLRKLKQQYPTEEKWTGLYLKRIFFEKTVRELQPQMVHLHGASSIWYQDLVPDACKIAVTFHGMIGLDSNIKQHEIFYRMERDVFQSPRVAGVFFICTQLVDSFINTYGDNGKNNRVIFNSYDNTQFYLDNDALSSYQSDKEATVQGGVKTLCTVASLSDRKGQLRVLSGLTSLPDRKKFNYFCIGGGDPNYIEKLKKYADENGINYEYLGKMNPDNIRRNLYKADYMIMPSSSEGFGLTYLEAIACGVPVILPKDIPIAQEKELVNECNSILLDDCSSESITKVLGHIDDYHFDRQSVANTISGTSWDEIVRQYISAYHEILMKQ